MNDLDSIRASYYESSKETEPEEKTETKKPSGRTSVYGFLCSHCNRFTYIGYDARDKKNLPNKSAVCKECGDFYEDAITEVEGKEEVKEDNMEYIVIVQNALRDVINTKLNDAFTKVPEAEKYRKVFFQELLEYYDDYGVIPDFEIQKMSKFEVEGGKMTKTNNIENDGLFLSVDRDKRIE
ncbi:MAG: hypothetical protein DDT18_00602 [Actinobacteria bacterium]|nr:hypothetical protein [Actinomycetota bacterium]